MFLTRAYNGRMPFYFGECANYSWRKVGGVGCARVGAQVEQLDVAVVVARQQAALVLVEGVAEGHTPSIPRLTKHFTIQMAVLATEV